MPGARRRRCGSGSPAAAAVRDGRPAVPALGRTALRRARRRGVARGGARDGRGAHAGARGGVAVAAHADQSALPVQQPALDQPRWPTLDGAPRARHVHPAGRLSAQQPGPRQPRGAFRCARNWRWRAAICEVEQVRFGERLRVERGDRGRRARSARCRRCCCSRWWRMP